MVGWGEEGLGLLQGGVACMDEGLVGSVAMRSVGGRSSVGFASFGWGLDALWLCRGVEAEDGGFVAAGGGNGAGSGLA